MSGIDALVALGLAANVVQIWQFVRNTFDDAHEIYNATNGVLVRNQDLESISRRLVELTQSIRAGVPSEKQDALNYDDLRNKARNDTDRQLLELADEAAKISETLQGTLNKLKTTSNSKWQSVRKALLSAWKEKDLRELESRLDSVRQQMNTTLLVNLRYLTRLQVSE